MTQDNKNYIDRELVERLSRRIKEIRTEHNHSQEYLVENLHLSIQNYENGSRVPTIMSIYKICQFYGISLGEFFSQINLPAKK